MKTILVLLATAITFLSADAAFGGVPNWRSSEGKGPFLCDNGHTYQIRGNTVYVDGAPAPKYVDYWFHGAGDSYELSVWENGFKRGNCLPVNIPSRVSEDDQSSQADTMLETVALRHHRKVHPSHYSDRGQECFSYYCLGCSHGSTTRGYPLLFGHCY